MFDQPHQQAPYISITPSFEAAHAWFASDPVQHVLLLGALEYDPVATFHGIASGGELAALALVLEPEGPPRKQRAPVLLHAQHSAAVEALLHAGVWPAQPRWVVQDAALLPALEAHCQATYDPTRGIFCYITDHAPPLADLPVRLLTLDDADELDLFHCALSPTALRNWIRRGWRVWGAVEGGALLCHALASYPVANIEEVSAVFTAPRARQRGLAHAVVAATVADIVGRGRRALYTCHKTNTASQRVALGVGMALLHETWEIVP